MDLDYLVENWHLIAKKDKATLKLLQEAYFEITNEIVDLNGCGSCITKAFNTIKKTQYNQNMAKKIEDNSKQYVLKEGLHQMVPGGVTYTNETLSDELAAKFLSLNPNLKRLFIKLPE